MHIKTTLLFLALSVWIAGCGGPGENAEIPQAEKAGETSKDIGDFVVHFSAQSTDQLTTEIARAYNIVRSKDRAMLTISIVRKADNRTVPGNVAVKTVNLTGQMKNVVLRRIDEQDAVYYIGETAVANRETLVFDITVTPEGAKTPSEMRFKREFYTDA